MKMTSFICWMTIAISVILSAEPLQIEVKGVAAILINAESRAILFEKEAYTPHYPASTTKVATALYALKKKGGELETLVVADQEALVSVSPEIKRQSHYNLPAYWLETDGCHIGLKKEEAMTIRDLLKGMLISSGNDASNVIAQSVGGTIPCFIEELNQFLKEIGCRQTTFYNPHGLHHPQHQTTAYDLALITQEALKNPIFCEMISQTRFIRPKTNKQETTTLAQTNRLLRTGKFYYPKAIGGKTGYHSKAKHTFIGIARSEERTLIAVLLGAPNRNQIFQDAIKLFDAAFNQPKVQHIFLKSGPQSFTQNLLHAKRELQTFLAEDLLLEYYPAEDPKPKCLLYWDELSLPIQKGQQVGILQLVTKDQSQVLKTIPLLALEKVELRWPYRWIDSTMSTLHTYPFLSYLGLITSLAICLIGYRMWRKRDQG